MKTKTSELSGAGLNYATLIAIGGHVDEELTHSGKVFGTYGDLSLSVEFDPQGDWAQGGPLIEQHCSDLNKRQSGGWWAHSGNHIGEGCTSLIAACRAIVAANLGDEVELPESLR